jgi:hypothetical protein
MVTEKEQRAVNSRLEDKKQLLAQPNFNKLDDDLKDRALSSFHDVPAESLEILESWYLAHSRHPYPSEKQMFDLEDECGIGECLSYVMIPPSHLRVLTFSFYLKILCVVGV